MIFTVLDGALSSLSFFLLSIYLLLTYDGQNLRIFLCVFFLMNDGQGHSKVKNMPSTIPSRGGLGPSNGFIEIRDGLMDK